MGASKRFFEVTTKIEHLTKELDTKIIGHRMNRKDILVNSVFPLYVTDMMSEFFFHEVDSEYIPKGTVDYYGRFDANDKSVHIEIIHNPEDTEYRWTAPLWGYIRGVYFDTISHEMVHIYQNERRKETGITDTQRNPTKKEFKCLYRDDEAENGLYLISPDEVEAHSYNFASQLFRRYRSVEDALQALRTGKFDSIETFDVYVNYIKKNSYVYKRLMKKTTWYLLNKYDENTYKNSECNEDVVENNQ